MTNHLEMVKRAAAKSRTEFFWLIANCCDYTNFNFDYVPTQWEQDQIHCWASGTQKFGDTFLINVNAWKKQSNVEKLEWYNHINYHASNITRLEWPIIKFDDDLTLFCLNHNFTSLYTSFIASEQEHVRYDMNLWDQRPVIAFNNTGHVCMCPRDIKQKIKKQIYDYPFILKDLNKNFNQQLQDIVFISYDEINADKHWTLLKDKFPRSKRVHGVKGLLNALKAAAEQATTSYFYAVFAKTIIDENFNFDYQPDYLKEPSNYVFLAYNPILKHSYGHGAVIMHNRQWLLDAETFELDISMSLPVVTVPVISCVNLYNETPWSAYRTAFREVYKLLKMTKIEDQYHLNLWLTSSDGQNGSWSQLGANDSLKYGKDSNINDWDYIFSLFSAYSETMPVV